MKATGFKGASNISFYELKKNGEPFDLSSAGVVRLEVVQAGKIISSENGSITFDKEFINIKWGDFNLPSGSHKPKIYAYKSGDTKGEVLFGHEIDLKMIADERPQ